MAFETDTKRTNQFLIARRKMTISIATGKTGSADLEINGEILNYSIVAPSLTTDTDFNFTLVNEDSQPIYANTGIAHNATTPVLVSDKPIPVSGTITFTVTCAHDQTAEDFVVYIYYK